MPMTKLPKKPSLNEDRTSRDRRRAKASRVRRAPGVSAPAAREASPLKIAKSLAKAAGEGDVEMVRTLVATCPEAVSAPEPIIAAAWGGYTEVVHCLLENGADADALCETEDRYRPLHRVIEHKRTMPKTPEQVSAVQALLDGGADVLARGTWMGVHALALAAIGPEKEFLPLLLPHFDMWDIFTAAVLGEDRHVATMVQRDSSLAHAADSNGWTALHYCAASRLGVGDGTMSHRLARCARLLLDAGADPQVTFHHPERGTQTPAKWAHGNRAVLEALLERGAKPIDALQPAMWESNFETSTWLLKQGIDLKHPLIGEYISEFAHYGLFPQSRWLIERGGFTDGRDKDGRTALHWAAQRGAPAEFARFLLDNGADARATDWAGETPLRMAADKKKTPIVKLLKERGAI